MHTHSEAHPFRDNSAGTEAKRRKLLSDRRDQLATMNHEIRRVYIARLSGLGAALALTLGGGLLVAASYSASLADSLGSYMPGSAPAPLSTLLLATWLLAALTYLGARALGEHRFNVAMSRAVLPTEDVHVDVARLSHESPDAVGCHMAQHLETPSRLASLAAVGVVMPATILVGLLALDAMSYPPVDQVESYLGSASPAFLAIALLALANVLAVAVRPMQRSLGLLAVNSAGCALVAFAAPSAMLYLLPAALLLSYVSVRAQRIHRKQNARIQQEGAPLPPVFALRQRLHKVGKVVATLPTLLTVDNFRLALRRVRARLRALASYRPSGLQVASVAMLIGGALAIAIALWPGHAARASAASASKPSTIDIVTPIVPSQSYAERIDDSGDGALIDLHFEGGLPIDATYLLGGAAIPSGWRATITLTRVSGDGAFFVQSLADTANQPPRQVTESSPSVVIEQSNCGPVEMPLSLRASAYGGWADDSGSAQLRYQVNLEMMGTCGDGPNF